MRPKLVALIAASSISAGWLLASLIVPPVAKLQGLPARVGPRAVPPSDEAVTTYTEQLHLRLKQTPAAPVPRRNPFVFATRNAPRLSPTAATTPTTTEAEPIAIPPPVVTGPRLRLTGVGSTGGVWTGVISDGATVHLVKVGETINGYAVIDIREHAVTIGDASGAQWTLRMN